MAHFAKIENNIVTQIIVISNEELVGDFPENESMGIEICNSLIEGDWKQTSYNNNFRVRFAGIGYEYNAEHDAFIVPSPYPSWVLNLETFIYEAPVAMPEDGKKYVWSEDNLNWEEIITMETTLTQDYTQEQLDENYGDDLFIHDALTQTFQYANPSFKILGSAGASEDNGDGTYTYTITIEYEKTQKNEYN